MIRVYILALLASWAFSTPAFAQDDNELLESEQRVGSRIAKGPETVRADLVRKMQKGLARCIYRRHQELADRYLLSSDPINVDFELLGIEIRDLHDKFSLSKCLSDAMRENQSTVSMKFDLRLFRPLLAEEAYLDRNRQPLLLSADADEFLSDRIFVSTGDLARAKGVAAFADCVVYHAPADSDALLRTGPASVDENEAVRKLVPGLSKCLVEGQEVSLTPLRIRTLVAEGLWARSHHSSAVAATQGERDEAK